MGNIQNRFEKSPTKVIVHEKSYSQPYVVVRTLDGKKHIILLEDLEKFADEHDLMTEEDLAQWTSTHPRSN